MENKDDYDLLNEVFLEDMPVEMAGEREVPDMSGDENYAEAAIEMLAEESEAMDAYEDALEIF